MPVVSSAETVSCAAALAAGAELSLLSALAEYLLMRTGIAMADNANAVNISVASDFFIVELLYLSLPFAKTREVRLIKGTIFKTNLHLPLVKEANYTYGNR
jgi:hypothetical protein